MTRSAKKGPFVDERLYRKVEKNKQTGSRDPIKTWSRPCTIVPEFIGQTFMVHNGKTFHKIFVTEEHGRPQAGRVLADANLPRTRNGQERRRCRSAGAPGARLQRPRASNYEVARWHGEQRINSHAAAPKGPPDGDMVRNRDVQDALNILKFTPNLGAGQVRKALTSAVANANEAEADVESLFVSEIFVNDGPFMKRFIEKDRGRAKRSSSGPAISPWWSTKRRNREANMGQKVNPIGFRTGVTIGWKSRWFAPKSNYGEFLVEDEKIRRYVDEKLNRQPPHAGMTRSRSAHP